MVAERLPARSRSVPTDDAGSVCFFALGHTGHSAVSIFRTDFPALPGHIKKRTQRELNLMHLNKGKFDGKNARRSPSIHSFVLQRVTFN
jgi:hypothetical protein